MKKYFLLLNLFVFLHFYPLAQASVKRMMKPADLYRLPYVGSPQISPDGKWVVYTVTSVDSLKDKRISNLWMASWDGTQIIQLTSDAEGESNPKWSPDGKYISFLSSRQESKTAQIWLMDRRGGEGMKITDIKQGINDYAWSPDGKNLLLTITDKEREDTGKIKTVSPYVIDRYQYKEDIEGYRYKKLYTHLYVFNIHTKKIDT